jgi:hypothetical protein
MEIPVGDLSPWGTRMRKQCSPQAFVEIPSGKFFRRGDGDGKLFLGGEFPIAIPRPNGPCLAGDPGHDPFNSAWASPTRLSCRGWAVASARSADPARHDYIFYFTKLVYTYIQFIFNNKNINHDVLLVRWLHLVSPALLPSGLGFKPHLLQLFIFN